MRNCERCHAFELRKKGISGGVLPPDSDEFVSDDNLFNYQAKGDP